MDAVVAHGRFRRTSSPKCASISVAGADHVMLLPAIGGDFATGVDQLEQIRAGASRAG